MRKVDNSTFLKWISDVSKNYMASTVLTSATRTSIFTVLGVYSKDEVDFISVEKLAEKLNYFSTRGLSSILLLATAYKIVNFKIERREDEEGIKRLYQFSRGDNFELFGSEGTKLHKISVFIGSQDFTELPRCIRNGDFTSNHELGTYFKDGSNKVASFVERSKRSEEFTLSSEEFFELMFWIGTISSRLQRDAVAFFGIPQFYYGRIDREEPRIEPKGEVTCKQLIRWIVSADLSSQTRIRHEQNEYVMMMIDILEWCRWLKREIQEGVDGEGCNKEIVIYKVGSEVVKIENCPKTFGEDQDSIDNAYHHFWQEFERSVSTGKAGVFFRYDVDYLNTKPMLVEEYHKCTDTQIPSQYFAAHAITSDCSNNPMVMEVGGSLGYFILTLLAKYPSLRCVVFDLPEVLNNGIPQLQVVDEEIASRCKFVGGSFFDHVPPIEYPNSVFFLKNILLDWSNDDLIRILKCVAAAMRKSRTSSLQIIELFFDEEYIFESARFDFHTLLCWSVPLLSYYDYNIILREADFIITEEGRMFPGVCYVNASLI